ncbi:MAG: hypothetical protein J0I10_20015 [Verrucomicrobia bacterium]|nr:hypothetical protein [Verrucomicrobiota bacterium]
MAWIESHQEMARHPKTRRVAVRLGISKAAVIGHLHLLWWWTLDFAPDGDLSGFEAEEIASVAEWEGDAGQFLQALLETGWLDEGRRVHNWEDYAGRLVTLREENRERQRRCREKKRDVVPPGGDDVEGVPRAGRAKVAAKSQACRPDVPAKSQTRNGGIKVASPLRNADVTAMSQLCHADVTVTSQLRHGATEPDQTEQNRTEPNRERVARGRAGGPAERSGGVPSLSRSRELVAVGEPAPVGGEHSGRGGDVLPRDQEDRREGGEPLREADAVPTEGDASGEAGRFSPEAGGSLREEGESSALSRQARCAEALPGAGDWSEGGEQRPKEGSISSSGEECSFDDREASRGSGQLQPADAVRRDSLTCGGGESFVEDGVSLPRSSGDWREGGEPGYGDESMSPHGGGRLLDARESSRADGELPPVDAEERDAPSRGGGLSSGNREGNRTPLDAEGRALPGAGPVSAEGGAGRGGRDLSPMDAMGGDDGLRAGCDGERLSREVREALQAGAEESPADCGRLAAGAVAGGGLPRGEGRWRDDRDSLCGGGELPPAGGEATGRGEESISPRDEGRGPAGVGRRAELEAREALRQDGAFREAWLGWRQHLEDLGRPLISRGQERALLRECARRGAERAMEVIAYSITRGAKNLIWDDAPRAKRVRQPTVATGRAPNPDGWPEWLAGEYPDRVGIAYADAPESVQGEFRRAARKTG